MVYRLVYWISWPLFKLFYRIKFIGRENMPENGPVLLVSNHSSYLDPICLGLASRRPVHFMAKDQLFNYPILKQVLPRLKAFSVRRDQSDRQALRKALTKLNEGQVVGIFPQGSRIRDNEVVMGKQGAALLAFKSGAFVLPAAIDGSAKVLPDGAWLPRFPRITVKFGRPFKVDGAREERKQVITKATDEIMLAINELLERVES